MVKGQVCLELVKNNWFVRLGVRSLLTRGLYAPNQLTQKHCWHSVILRKRAVILHLFLSKTVLEKWIRFEVENRIICWCIVLYKTFIKRFIKYEHFRRKRQFILDFAWFLLLFKGNTFFNFKSNPLLKNRFG